MEDISMERDLKLVGSIGEERRKLAFRINSMPISDEEKKILIQDLEMSLEKVAEEALDTASYDVLTGLKNKNAYLRDFGKIIQEVKYGIESPISMAIFDLDDFKKVNDTYGHEMGDEVLKHFTKNLYRSSRQGRHLQQNDELYRFGGEEIVLLMKDTSSIPAGMVAERCRKYVEENPFPHRGIIDLTVSVGVSTYDTNCSIEDLFKTADQALYDAKNNGKNRVEISRTSNINSKRENNDVPLDTLIATN